MFYRGEGKNNLTSKLLKNLGEIHIKPQKMNEGRKQERLSNKMIRDHCPLITKIHTGPFETCCLDTSAVDRVFKISILLGPGNFDVKSCGNVLSNDPFLPPSVHTVPGGRSEAKTEVFMASSQNFLHK